MSEERNFDDYIKGEFKSYSPNVPARIWENIAAKREGKKPVGFWFTLISGANLVWLIGLIMVGSAGIFLFSHTITYHPSNIDKTIITGNNNTVDNINSANANAVSKENNTKPILISPDTNDALATSNNKEDNSAKQSVVDAAENSATDFVLKNKTISHKQLYNRHAGIVHIKTVNGIDNADETTIGLVSQNDEDVIEGNNITATKIKGKHVNNAVIQTLEFKRNEFEKAMLLSLSTKPAQSVLRQKNLPECPTIEKEASGNKKYFEVYISPDYALRTLTDTANSVYLQKRLTSTSVASAFSAGIRYTKVFNNSTSIRFGINYSQINESFTYIQGNVVQTTYNIDPVTGDTTGSYTVRGSRYKTSYNHYRNLDIPVTIGYELGNGRFHANINAGLIVNMYSWQNGNELDTNSQPVSITTGKGPSAYQFRTNIGLGATAGASVYYKVTDQIHFLAEPYIRYNFQSLSKDNITLRQKYTTIGLRLGLRFDLHNPGSIINK